MYSIFMNKEIARKYGLQKRKALSAKDRKDKSHAIFLQLLPFLTNAEHIGCYIQTGYEVETQNILEWCFQHSKHVCAPKVTGNTLQFFEIQCFQDLKEGSYHIKEPVTKETATILDIDLMLVPLSAFDPSGNRCGYGKGYYDSILKDCKKTIGLAYNCQKVDTIDCEKHDIPLQMIITETAMYTCTSIRCLEK